MIEELSQKGHFLDLDKYIAHGHVTVKQHSISVACKCYELAKRYHLKIDEDVLIRSALLHDYYLYDWHDSDPNRPLHGIYHQYKAAENAKDDYQISEKEVSIIRSHMFPLPLQTIPTCEEAWVLTLADKIIATKETLKR